MSIAKIVIGIPGDKPLNKLKMLLKKLNRLTKKITKIMGLLKTHSQREALKYDALLVRTYEEKQTKGDFSFEDFKCKMLELPWLENQRYISCIPEGVYFCTKEIHGTFGKCFRIHEVPGRSGVLCHYGNYVASKNPNKDKPDTEGCPLPGSHYGDLDGDGYCEVLNSKPTINKMYDILPDSFTLKITEK
jgi:hypothetical protein